MNDLSMPMNTYIWSTEAQLGGGARAAVDVVLVLLSFVEEQRNILSEIREKKEDTDLI